MQDSRKAPPRGGFRPSGIKKWSQRDLALNADQLDRKADTGQSSAWAQEQQADARQG